MEKAKIIDAVAAQLDAAINSFQQSIKELNAISDMDESETRTVDDYSQQDESTEMQHHYEVQIAQLEIEKNLLESFKSKHCTELIEGAVAQTDKNYLIIGVSFIGAQYDGKDIVAVSIEAPIYQNWAGKKAGDIIPMGDTSLTIVAVR